MEILLLFGTQTGNAETVSEAMARHLAELGYRVHFVDLLDAYPEMLADFSAVVLCSSTWGDGELPDNAIDFYETLDSLSPDLGHIQYGIVALGDHVYDPNFCKAALILDEIFSRLGAKRPCNIHEIDAGPSEQDIKDACLWATEFSQHILAV